ncbi:MAG: type II 3-dehydroquinate dehydratase [Bifidobacteriaceae bacterium]|nr:type II 3-dehydroquinate dehydratase [Bifidobacteriaceae bacterium]
MRQVLVLNGPNLGRLGSREPEIYGTVDHAALADLLAEWGSALGLEVSLRQTDEESRLIEWIHQAADAATPVILNPAAFTHYSYALRDAVADLTSRGVPLIEVHLSNPASREPFRRNSTISEVATGTIAGFGPTSYHLALQALPPV